MILALVWSCFSFYERKIFCRLRKIFSFVQINLYLEGNLSSFKVSLTYTSLSATKQTAYHLWGSGDVMLHVRRDNCVTQALCSLSDAICFIDVAFILDSSESSKIVLFDNQKDFVDSLSERIFQLTPGRSLKYDIRLAALQFSSSVQIDPPFSSWKDLPTFKQRVTSLNLIGQGTFSYYAISNATRLLKREGRKDGVKVALLMTDGIDHPKSPDVQSISEDARISGISFITVGLSTVVNEAKLRLISGDSSNEPVLLLSDPTLVDKIQERLVGT